MAKLLCAIMYSNPVVLVQTLDYLKKHFGAVLATGPEYEFNFTDYYTAEFGINLKKKIFIFYKDIEKSDLVSIRNLTGKLEQQLTKLGKRTVNIDPGYLSKSELVLATRKSRPFKEFLGDGIFCHKVIEFTSDKVNFFHHTFADYKKKENIEFFNQVRFGLF